MTALVNNGEHIRLRIIWMAECAVPAVLVELGAMAVDILHDRWAAKTVSVGGDANDRACVDGVKDQGTSGAGVLATNRICREDQY